MTHARRWMLAAILTLCGTINCFAQSTQRPFSMEDIEGLSLVNVDDEPLQGPIAGLDIISITFEVDKGLSAPKETIPAYDDQEIAQKIVDVIQIPQELHRVVKTSFEGERLCFLRRGAQGKQDAAEEAQNSAPAPKPNSNPFKGKNNIPGFEGMDELWDNMMDSGQKVIDNNKQSKVDESEQRSKASELFGTDLNKSQGHDYDRLSQELDKGDFVNLDAGLLPYEHGFETSGHEDLAVDARKNPETGKYEVHMYPETEDGPVSGYEPGQNEPTYEFDTFDDLKAFMENGYKKQEVPQWNKDNNPGSVVVTKELQDWVRDYLTKQVGKDYADTVANNLANDNKVADFYKGLMKADWDKKHGK